jgi:F-type H+-transporting ATPase subunit b
VSRLRSIVQLLAIACALALPAVALAGQDEPAAGAEHQAGGEGHGEQAGEHEAPSFNAGRLAFQLANFALLIAILYLGGRGPVRRALQARHQQIQSDLASAAEARAAAQARFEHQEKRLAALESEIAAITAGIKQEAEAEKARLIATAEDRARRIREESEFVIEQQVKQAEEDLRREVAAAAVALAERIVRTQMGAGDQQRLVDTFVGDIAHSGKQATPRSRI